MAESRDTYKGFKTKAILIILGLLVGIAIFVYFVYGFSSITKFFTVLLEIIMFMILLGAFLYAFYILFIKKNKFDVNYVNKKKLIEAGKKIKRPFMNNLYVSGDNKHSRGLIGKITGYVRIQTLVRNYQYEETKDEETGRIIKKQITEKNDRGEEIPVYILDKVEQDVFIIQTGGKISSFFEDEMVIRVDPTDHDDLVGDVTLYGFSIIPISEYWFLNTDHLDVRKIDHAILQEAERTISFKVLSDIHEHVNRATGIDSDHRKAIESKSLVDIPETQRLNNKSQYE